MLVDLHTSDMDAAFAAAPLYRKSVIVPIRTVEPGTEIRTVLADGTVETTNTATVDQDQVITNPGGEEYLISTEKRDARYEPIGDGLWRAKGMARMFHHGTGGHVTVVAPWGEEQHGDQFALYAMAVDPAHPDELTKDRYLIGLNEAAETYKLVEHSDF